jgi:Alpha-galactosidase, CBM13 domain
LIFRRRPRPPAEPGAPQTPGTKPADDKRARPRGLRPLPVVALCCVVAVLAVMMTRAVGMPLYSSGGAHAGTPDATDTQVDAATGEQSEGSDESDGTDQPTPDEPGAPTTAPATNPTTGGAPPPAPPPGGGPPPAPPAAPPVSRPGPPSNQPPPPPHSATPSPAPPPATSYEAEASVNTLAGATVVSCSGCSGGKKVGHVGHGTGTLRFNQVISATTANRTVTISYVNGDPTRTATLSVDGGAPITIDFPSSGGWSTVRTIVLTLPLTAGPNTLTFASDGAAPDFDRITVD